MAPLNASTSSHVTLGGFIAESGLDLDDIYSGGKGWSDLLETAGLVESETGDHEVSFRRAVGRMLHVDDPLRLDFAREQLGSATPPTLSTLATRQGRLLRMVVTSLVGKDFPAGASLDSGVALLWRHHQVRRELLDLFDVLAERRGHLATPLATHPDVPLSIHASYTRIEILAAFGVGHGAKVAPWQSGVYFAHEANADLLAFTLDKTTGHFSPTTRYRDYAISRNLIHWESQSITRADSDTGRRYQEHAKRGSAIMLFARLNTSERAFHFLGPADYVKHEGELPMAVTWRLQHPLPGDLFASFAAAVA